MINREQRLLLHKYLILDLAIQSIKRDFSVIENLKLSKVYLPILDKLLKDITSEWYSLKSLLAKDKIKIVKWEKADEYFSDLTITTAGNDLVLRYSNHAVKTQVEKMLLDRLNK